MQYAVYRHMLPGGYIRPDDHLPTPSLVNTVALSTTCQWSAAVHRSKRITNATVSR
ncbi:MAG: hypothetical protein ACLU3I_02875 [Acutalibacteraceae bacterium]